MAAPARAKEILDYLVENDYKWAARTFERTDDNRNHIELELKNGRKVWRRLSKAQLIDLIFFADGRDDEAQIKEALTEANFHLKPKGGGGGRTAMSRDEYTQQLIDMGLENNKAGVLQLNVAKLWDFDYDHFEELPNGKTLSHFPKKHFDFSIDRRTKTITLKLK